MIRSSSNLPCGQPIASRLLYLTADLFVRGRRLTKSREKNNNAKMAGFRATARAVCIPGLVSCFLDKVAEAEAKRVKSGTLILSWNSNLKKVRDRPARNTYVGVETREIDPVSMIWQ